jgi:prepilin-type N-terminal cleavage/methylation domain-containing protein
MMRSRDSQSGVTLVELLVVMFIFALLSTVMYSILLSGVDGSETAGNVARISEEARLGFNRMVRDAREAERLVDAAADGTSFTIRIDFDRDGNTNEVGEEETFVYDPATDTITVEVNDSPATGPQVLMRGVEPIGATPVFDFSSNFLEYDVGVTGEPVDGIASWQEIHSREDSGALDLDSQELPLISNISFAVEITSEDRSEEFQAEAQLRNRR